MKRQPLTDTPPADEADQPREGDIAFSVDGFCRASSLGRSFVYQAIKDRKLRTVTRGRRRLILRQDAEAFLRGEV
jgi:excisionase family DNA binding protein